MSKPFDEFPISVAAYLADTQHLSTLQHGAYLLLLMTMRRAGGYLPNNDRQLAKICRLTLDKWNKISADIRELLIVDGDKITQKRVLADLKKQTLQSEKNAISGRAGGLSKSLKNKEVDVADAKPPPPQRQTDQENAHTRILESTVTVESKKPVRAKKNQGELLPSDWVPKPAHYAKGDQLGFSRQQIDLFAERMRNWAGANAHRPVARKSNWDQAFHNWISDRAEKNAAQPLTISNGGANGHEANRGRSPHQGRTNAAFAAELRASLAAREAARSPAASGEPAHRRADPPGLGELDSQGWTATA